MEVQVRGILEKANAFGRQTLLFSATLPHFLQRLVRSAVLNPIILHTIGKNKKMQQDFGGLLTLPTSCVKQTLLYMKQFEKKNKLLQILRNNIPFPPVLIFCNAIETVDFVTHLLHMEQFHVASFHGQKPQTYRFQVLQALREGFVDILVATDLASRGLNLPIEMNHIILYDLPLTIEDYIHRCGRIGRQGIQGQVYGFLTNQCTIAKELKQVLEENQQKVPLELQTLHRFASF
jgi:superfamily II DNA/RNA helicase